MGFNQIKLKRKPESYTRKKGHYVGCDGFVVPKNFAEFHGQFPKYVEEWVWMNVHKPTVQSRDDVLDVASELTLFLMTLPKGSVKRTRTIRDVIAAFDPARCEGASKAKFFRYVNFTLWNALTSIWRRQGRDAAFQNKLSIEPVEADDGTHDGLGVEWQLATDGRVEEDADNRIQLDQFMRFIAAEAEVHALIVALYACGSMRKARKRLGWTQTGLRYTCDRLRVLAHCFTTGEPVPVAVKQYKARRKSTPMD